MAAGTCWLTASRGTAPGSEPCGCCWRCSWPDCWGRRRGASACRSPSGAGPAWSTNTQIAQCLSSGRRRLNTCLALEMNTMWRLRRVLNGHISGSITSELTPPRPGSACTALLIFTFLGQLARSHDLQRWHPLIPPLFVGLIHLVLIWTRFLLTAVRFIQNIFGLNSEAASLSALFAHRQSFKRLPPPLREFGASRLIAGASCGGSLGRAASSFIRILAAWRQTNGNCCYCWGCSPSWTLARAGGVLCDVLLPYGRQSEQTAGLVYRDDPSSPLARTPPPPFLLCYGLTRFIFK